MTSLNIIVSPVDIEARKALDFQAGDTVKVYQKVHEGEKTRLQVFEGLVLGRKHGSEAGATFAVRKISAGVGVERIFPLFSPEIDRIEIRARAHRHKRAKIYYVRDRAAREIRKKMKHIFHEGKGLSSTDVTKARFVKKEVVAPAKIVANS